MVIATGDTAKNIYKEMHKIEFVPQQIYDYEIPCGIVAIDRQTGDCAIAKRKGSSYVAMKGKAAEFLIADIVTDIPEVNYIDPGEINDLIIAAHDVIYRKKGGQDD